MPMTIDERRAIAQTAIHLRAGAEGNPVALHAAHELIDLIGGEAEVAFLWNNAPGEREADYGDISEDQSPEAIAEQVEAATPHFKLRIALGNDAMQTAEDVAGALRGLADHVAEIGGYVDFGGYRDAGSVRDENGNTVGMWELS
jgi:hypothetical protein